jgi:Ca-activated chloride channel homolog
MLEHAHFLRPWWLVLLVAAIILFFLPRPRASSTVWQRIVDPHLLPYVISGHAKIKSFRLKRFYLPVFLALIALALAGPTVKKIPDMLAHDISPSRLKRALYKIKDFLDSQKAREVALVAYAGDAHVVVPLTEDYKTILSLSESLSPSLMPLPGSNLLDALKIARAMGDNNIIIMSSSNINDAEDVKSYIKRARLFWPKTVHLRKIAMAA